MKVLMLADNHGVQESVDAQIDALRKYSLYERPNPKKTIVLHEAVPEKWTDSVDLELAKMERTWAELGLPQHWGPSEPYKALFGYLGENGYSLNNLDHVVEEREELAGDFLSIVRAAKKPDADMEKISRRLQHSKMEIGPHREYWFCTRVDVAEDEGYETAVVITHPTHIDPVAATLTRFDRHVVDTRYRNRGQEAALGKKERSIQLQYARRRKLTTTRREAVPLVPVVELAWDIDKKFRESRMKEMATKHSRPSPVQRLPRFVDAGDEG
ncbi:MAG: hypothetical protein HYS81_04965 [Candidatus Aenigmatarchaeota archaeon]|nr:MAG: hypothetical protein HYS81_04965 [Candidatus Aenigmarchaeota archaeon]